MNLLVSVVMLVAALVVQAGLGRVWVDAHRVVDIMLLPLVICGVARSQRAAMLVGCVGGLLQDAWFQADVFGLNGFKKTLLGWILGGLGSRLDLNQGAGRLAAGVGVALGDGLLDIALRRLLDQDWAWPGLAQWLVPATMTGLLAVVVGRMMERQGGSRTARRAF